MNQHLGWGWPYLVRRGLTLAETEGQDTCIQPFVPAAGSFLCALQDFCSAGSDVINSMFGMNNVIMYMKWRSKQLKDLLREKLLIHLFVEMIFPVLPTGLCLFHNRSKLSPP